MLTRSPGNGPGNPKEGDAAEGEVTPLKNYQHHPSSMKNAESYLVARCDQCANKTGDDHNLVYQESVENCRPWHAGGQEQVQKQQRRSDNPSLVS